MSRDSSAELAFDAPLARPARGAGAARDARSRARPSCDQPACGRRHRRARRAPGSRSPSAHRAVRSGSNFSSAASPRGVAQRPTAAPCSARRRAPHRAVSESESPRPEASGSMRTDPLAPHSSVVLASSCATRPRTDALDRDARSPGSSSRRPPRPRSRSRRPRRHGASPSSRRGVSHAPPPASKPSRAVEQISRNAARVRLRRRSCRSVASEVVRSTRTRRTADGKLEDRPSLRRRLSQRPPRRRPRPCLIADVGGCSASSAYRRSPRSASASPVP